MTSKEQRTNERRTRSTKVVESRLGVEQKILQVFTFGGLIFGELAKLNGQRFFFTVLHKLPVTNICAGVSSG
jgi:hypothetical protein